MSLQPTADQRDLRAAVAAFLASHCGEAVVRKAEPLGVDTARWARCSGMGLPGLTVAVEQGGSGARRDDEGAPLAGRPFGNVAGEGFEPP